MVTDSLVPIVAVPARDEAERLPDLLQALAEQTSLKDARYPLAVVIVVNNSTDGSADVASRAAQAWPQLAVKVIDVTFSAARAHVGSARRLAMDIASDMLASVATGVLLTTDADARPAPNWVEANLSAIEEGADVVGGLIIGDSLEEEAFGAPFLRRAALQKHYSSLIDELCHLLDPRIEDPWPFHHDHTGASLAVRAHAYRAVGGIPALPSREDLALVSNLRLAGFRLRHDLDVSVTVSARLDGRAQSGMAACLRSWLKAEQAGLPLMVENVDRVVARLKRCHEIRTLFMAPPNMQQATAEALGIDLTELAFLIKANARSSALVERFAPDEPDAPAEEHAEHAISRLEARIAQLKGQNFAA